MAKGFTVKASKLLQRRMHLKRILGIITIKDRWAWKDDCVLSSRSWMFYIFLKNFLQLAFDLVQNGMSIQISQITLRW